MKKTTDIASLPAGILAQINHRLSDGQNSRPLVAWLNELPEVKPIVEGPRHGRPFTAAHLEAWKRDGFRIWTAHQASLHTVRQLDEAAAEISQAADGPLADQLALLLTARVAVAWRHASSTEDTPAGSPALNYFCALLVALRKGNHGAQRHNLEREKLAVKSKELAVAQAELAEKPNLGPYNWDNIHLSQEELDQAEAELRRI